MISDATCKLGVAALFVSIFAALWFARHVIVLLFASVLIALILTSLTNLVRHVTHLGRKMSLVIAWLLIVGAVGFKKNLIRSMMGSQVSLPDEVWSRLQTSWIAFFAVMGVLNLWVAFNFDTNTWVNFKLFGGLGLMALFVVAQALYLGRYVKDTKEAGAGDS